MYEQKYLKYKKKYLALLTHKGGYEIDQSVIDDYGGTSPDDLTIDDLDHNDEINEYDDMFDDDNEEIIEDTTLKKQKYVGDSNITANKLNRVIQLDKTYGKIHDYSTFSEEDFTNTLFPNKNKILMINNKDIFDEFTSKYGYLKKKDLKIEWSKVEKDFRGIFINSDIDNRVNDAPFTNKVYTSWIANQYHYIDDVVIFIKKEQVKYEMEIDYPFKGYVSDYYAIDEQLFVGIGEEITRDKIIVIDNIKHFDQFTEKYGNNKKIDWPKVSVDYIGFYITDDIELYKNRREKCFFDRKLSDSWWYEGKLKAGLVYMFL
jgi:hypothetical protein